MEFIAGLEFYTGVVHHTHVADRPVFTYIGVDRGFHEHTAGAFLIPVHREGNGILHKAQVQTDVGLRGLFPTEIRVGQAAGLNALSHALGGSQDVVAVFGGHYGVAEVADILVTVLTPGEAELGVGEPGGSMNVGFFVDIPTQGEGREYTPLVVGTETGRTVTTDGHLGHIALVVVVVCAGEVGGQAVFDIISAVHVHAAVFLQAGGVVDVRLVIVLDAQVQAGTAQLLAGGTEGALSQEGREAVLANGLVVGQDIFQLPAEALCGVGVGVGVFCLVVTGQVEQRGVTFVAPEAQVEGNGALEFEVVPNLEFSGETGRELMGPVLVCGEGQAGHRVHHFVVVHTGNHKGSLVVGHKRLAGVDHIVFGQLFIGGIHAQDGAEGQGRTQRGTPLGVLLDASGMDVGIG